MSARDGAPRTVARFVRHDVLPNAYVFELGCWNRAARDFSSTAAARHGAPGHGRPQGRSRVSGARRSGFDLRRPGFGWGGEHTECAVLAPTPNASPAGLTRGSILLRETFLPKTMDCRVKPGNDESCCRLSYRDRQPHSTPLAPRPPPPA